MRKLTLHRLCCWSQALCERRDVIDIPAETLKGELTNGVINEQVSSHYFCQ